MLRPEQVRNIVERLPRHVTQHVGFDGENLATVQGEC